jgi:8-amino-7-oxononanoate synthase
MAVAVWRGLIDAGVYVNLALPPATPYGYSLLRCSLCAAHTEDQLDQVVEIFADVAANLGLIERRPRKIAGA